MACDDRQLTEAQRVAGYQNGRTGVQQALRPFSGRPTLDNLLDYINRELVPAVRRTRDKVNDVYLPVVDNAPSGNPLGFYFSTETGAADPTAGRIRLNASPQDTATVMRVSQSNGRLVDVAPWLDVMAGGATTPLGVVTLTDAINPARFIRFDLSTMTDQGAYWDLAVAVIESSHDDPFVDGGAVVVSFIPGVGGVTPATVPPSSMSAIAANTVLANATASSAPPTAFSVGTNTVLGRVAGNIVAAQLVNGQITDATIANAKLANMAAGRLKGVQVDGATGAPQDLTGAEVSELTRRATVQTVSGVSGTLDIQLNDDTTVLLIRTTGNATLRTLESSTISDAGREIVIEHDRLSGTGILTIAHNTAGLYSTFFCPDTSDLYLGQTTCCTVRFRSGFWRPQGSMNSGFVFPGSPIYDVMRPPYNANGAGGADDTAAINAAIDDANAEPGDIYLGNHHLISGALNAVTGDNIFIYGRGPRADGTLIEATGATPYNVFTFDTARDCGLVDVLILAPGTWASRGLGVFIDDCFRTRIDRVEVVDTYGAIEIYASVITEIIDTYATGTLGPYGFYAYGSLADGENHALRFINCGTGSDPAGTIAWYKQGSGSHTFELINCGALEGGYGLLVTDDTPYTDSLPLFTRTLNFQADHCAINGIRLVNGATASFTHTFLTSTTGNAFHVESTYSGNWELNGGMFHATAGHGAFIAGDHWSMTGVQIGNIDAGFDMLHIDAGVTDFSVTGCTLGDIFGNNSVANYGINIGAGCTDYTIVGNRILGNDSGAINDTPGPATNRVIQGNTPTSVNTVRIDEIETMAIGTTVGRRIDAGSTGRPVALTGAEQAENWRRATIQTESGVSGTLDILLNDDTTVLLIRTTADATLRSLGDGLAAAGREIVIEHDRLSGSGNLTIQHNGATPTYSAFFNPNTSNLVLGQTSCVIARLRSGFWRPQSGVSGLSAIADDTFLANISGATAPPTAVALTTLAGAGLTGGADAILAVGAGTGITVNANDVAWNGTTTFVPDGDKGHIVVSSSGAVWNWDTTVAVTGAQVISTTADLTLTVGDDFFCTAQADVVINAGDTAGGVAIHAGLTPLVGANNNRVTISADDQVVLEPTVSLRFFTAGVERLEIEPDGAWQLGGATGTIGHTIVTAGASAPPAWGQLPTAGIADDAVTDAKLRNSAALSVIGRSANSTGDPADIAAANDGEVLRRSGTTLGFGTVATAGIANNAVTDAKLRQSAAFSVIGRSANSTGDVADITAGTDNHVLRRSGTTLGFGLIVAANITDNTITNVKLNNMVQSTIKGRAESAGTGEAQDLTSTQVAAIIDGEVFHWLNTHEFQEDLQVSNTFRLSAIFTTALTAANNLAIGNVNVVRFTGPMDPLTGMVAVLREQTVLLVNAHATNDVVIQLESPSSTAANRFAGLVTDRHIKPGEMGLAWYDDTSDRWRLLVRDEVDL